MKILLLLSLFFIGTNAQGENNVNSDSLVVTTANVIDSVAINIIDSVTTKINDEIAVVSDSLSTIAAPIDSLNTNKEEIKSDVIKYLEKLAIFKGDSTVNDSLKAIIYSSITEYIMDIKDSSENPVSPANPNFLSLVFNEKEINTNIDIPKSEYYNSETPNLSLDNSVVKNFEQSESDKIIKEAQQSVVANNPENVKYTSATMPEVPKNEKIESSGKKELVKVNTPTLIATNIETETPPVTKLWKHSFNSSIQVTEAYISKNWYQGGESNFNLISDQMYNVEYDHNNILFTTGFQWKLGISTAPSDTVHKISINDDLFQINSKLGIKAVKDWYYTVSLLFKTQLFSSYASNSETKTSAFFSPGELNLGVGMSYNKKIPERKFETSVMFAPLSYNLKFSLDKELAAKAGIKDDKLFENQVGSSFEGTFKWEFYPNLTWTSRLFYFTDYKSVLADLETGLNFIFNRFFSTKIYLHARYDDSVDKNKHHNHLQFKEMLSFGFNYKF